MGVHHPGWGRRVPGLPSRMLRLEMGPPSSAKDSTLCSEGNAACMCQGLPIALASPGHDLWNSENTQDPLLLPVSRSDSLNALPSAIKATCCLGKGQPPKAHTGSTLDLPQPSPAQASAEWGPQSLRRKGLSGGTPCPQDIHRWLWERLQARKDT